ncbi:MAG TPA: SIS domain-containing protein [Candidatus Nitrosotenuis sp.]|jgi:fructoselysine-6-P-deglycase FrlB-like protein|nr:SIS domain-containing protein [Candidatus Nitrosotenuis sp.]
MKTVEAFKADIFLQPKFLKEFSGVAQLSDKILERCVFCGTGDSLSAAMLAEAFSEYRVRALDPLDVIKNKKLLRGKKAYFVSISGNTISNIKAARLAQNATAITKNQSSRLAKACDDVIVLPYCDSGILTSGSIGFLASALMCISLVKRFKIKNPQKLFKLAQVVAKKITPKNRVFILGNQYTYPIALYGAAKMYEVLGHDAHYERIEQFSHMGMFCARRGDTVILLEQKNKHATRLARHLEKLGLNVYHPSISANMMDQVVFYTFVLQLVTLNAATKLRLSDCHFVTNKKIRNASSAMIY